LFYEGDDLHSVKVYVSGVVVYRYAAMHTCTSHVHVLRYVCSEIIYTLVALRGRVG
jgi:hypothetical protein